MAGIIRWRDIQNLLVTEDQINLLAGLEINASLLNQLDGFTGTGAALNLAIATVPTINTHIAKDLANAHPLNPNSLDGGVLAVSTVAKSKLAFNALDDVDKLVLENSIAEINTDLSQVQTQVANLYTVLFPSTTGDIAEQFDQIIGHIEKLENAHDATAISFGNAFVLQSNIPVGATQAFIPLDVIRFFKTGDEVEFRDTNSGPEVRTLIGVDYNGSQIGWTTPLLQEYRIVNSSTLKNISHANVQQSIYRSLRNTTDVLTGRLTINQSSGDNGLVINKTGLGYTASFNTFTGKTFADFSLELGAQDNTSLFQIKDNQKRLGFQVTDQGNVLATDYELLDRTTSFSGLVTKQSLTKDQAWTFPNRSGFIGIGDLSFTELLKVSLLPATKQVNIAPGFITDYMGQKIGAWISMDKLSGYAGNTIDIQAKFITDSQLLSLGSQWQVFVVYISDQDILNFFYGPKKATKAEAISGYLNFIPSAFMKLAKIIVQGDGLGGILQSSVEIIEDQRPFLTMGMSSSYYEEGLSSVTGWSAGSLVTLPANSRAGGLIQTYKIGRAQLEVYLDGSYQEVDKDYEETQGEPVGRIRVLKDIAPNSRLKFRITFAAAAVTGGFEVATLQSAYIANPLISVNGINGPVKLLSFDTDLLMEVEGSINITNKIYNLRSLIFQASTPATDLDKNQFYVDTNSDIIYHQYKSGVATDFNILAEIEDAKSVVKMTMFNAAGTLIPKGRAVALHPSIPNAVVFCNTSNSLSTSRCIGVTTENIEIGEYGSVATSGLFKISGLGIAHNTVVVVDPRNPGFVVSKSSVNLLPTDEYVEVGVVDGGHLLIGLVSIPKVKSIWKIGIAGETFTANETRLVRFAIDGETRGSVYKADKANANLDQKFWVVAAVQPTTNVAIGDSIELLKIIDLHSSEVAFNDQDIGTPLYLESNGLFKPWRLLNGSFTVGDAAIKIGMIEDRRNFIVDGIQMMGTAPGPSFS